MVRSSFWLALGGLLALVTGFHLLTLLRTPAPFVDEAWNANRAWGLLRTGYAYGTMDSGVFEHYAGYQTYFPWLGTWLHTPAMWLLGPSLFAMRLTSLAFGLVLLVAIYGIATRLYNRHTGLLAVGLVALSRSFIYSAHLARHDVIVAAFGFGAIALCLAERPGRTGRTGRTDRRARVPLKSVLAGLVAALALDVHLNAVLYLPVLGALYLAESGWSVPRLLRARRFWGFAAGLGAGLGYFAALHLRYASTWLALAKLGPAPTRVPPLLSRDPAVWWQSASDLVQFLVVIFTWAAPLLLIAVVVLWRRRTALDRRALLLFGALSLVMAAVVRTKDPYYAILLSPAGDLLVAALLAGALERAIQARRVGSMRSFVPAGVLVTAMAVALLAAAKVNVAAAFEDPMPDYRVTLDRIAAVVPPDSTVMGPQTYWFGLPPDQRYLAWEQLYYYRQYAPDSTLDDAFKALHVDYFLVDTRLERYLPEDKLPGLRVFLDTHAHLVAAIETDIFGRVAIYKMDRNQIGA